MLQNYSKYKVMQCFFDEPSRSWHIREISRMIKLAQPSVINNLQELLKEGLIIRESKGLYPTFKANRDNTGFKLFKALNTRMLIYSSKIIDYIEEQARPNCIVLFGSASRGEDTEDSDIDLFVQAKERKLSLQQYEKKLKRKINIMFEPEIKSLGKELLNNLINGQVISGYLKVL